MASGYSSKQSERVVAFLAEIETVCRRHGLAITDEDPHGAFHIIPYAPNTLEDAVDDTQEEEEEEEEEGAGH